MNLNYEGPGVYRHYKGSEYEVLGLAVQENSIVRGDLGVDVMYRPLNSDAASLVIAGRETSCSFFSRPIADFNAEVRVDGDIHPRFERISDRDLEFVGLDHLECMGIDMALQRESDKDGLSEPQQSAFDKIQRAFSILFAKLNLGG